MLHRPRAALLAAFLSLLSATPAAAQQFPQSLPANSVVCRLGVGPGPAQACSFDRLKAALGIGTGPGTVTSIGCGGGLTGGTITNAGTCAVDFGTTVGKVAQGNDPRITGALQGANNLSDVGSAATARSNLGVGSLGQQDLTALNVSGVTQLTGLPACALAADACPKSYIDGLAAGFHVIPGIAAARLATAAVLPNSPTYSNGTAGVGATLTAGSNTTLTVDGTVVALNDIVLVNTQAAALQNGIYTATAAGDGSNPWVLTRHTSFDAPAEMTVGAVIAVTAGATNINKTFSLAATVTTVGTTAANFNVYLIAPAQQWTLSGSDAYRGSGNVGIGGAPNAAWAGTYKVIQLSTNAAFASINSATGSVWQDNIYFDGTNERYIANGFGAIAVNGGSTSGQFDWYASPSGTAGAVAATPLRMRLKNDGTLQLFAYGTGVTTFDASGNLASKLGYTTSIIYGSDYGMLCDNSTNDRNAFQNAISATEALSGNGGILQLPAGSCVINSGVTMTKPITIQGVGMGAGVQDSPGVGIVSRVGATVIAAGFTSGDMIAASGLHGWTFKDMQFASNVGPRASGAAIAIRSSYYNGNSNTQTKIERVQFDQQYDGIYVDGPANHLIQGNRFINWVHTGMNLVENPLYESSGGIIQNNVFFNFAQCGSSTPTDDSAITLHMGYTDIINNQFICGRFAVHWIVDTFPAGRLRIAGNIVENQSTSGFYLQNGGTVSAGMLMIYDNEFSSSDNYSQSHITIVAGSSQWLDSVSISRNIFRSQLTAGGSTTFIAVSDGKNVQISNNVLHGFSGTAYGIGTGGNVTAPALVSDNTFSGSWTAHYSLSAAVTLRDLQGLTVAQAAALSVTNGSQVYLSNGTPGTFPCTASVGNGSMAFAQGGFKCF